MNVLKPHLKATIRTLLDNGVSQREIKRKTGIDRKTIRSYYRLDHFSADQEGFPAKSPTGQEVATGIEVGSVQNPPPRPPAAEKKLPKHARRGLWGRPLHIYILIALRKFTPTFDLIFSFIAQ